MHRVDSNQQKTVLLRIVAYSVTLILTVITTALLLYVALGYRFDRTGHVTRNGLLLVDNHPEAGSVYINNDQKDGATPSRFVLNAGTYSLALKRSGYYDWSKQVEVAASGVREVEYPLLIPTKLSPKNVAEFDIPQLVSQSKNRKLLLTHITNASQLQLIELDPESPKQTTLSLPKSIKRESGNFGSFAVIEWALNNKQVLMQQTLPSGTTQLISLDVTKPEEAVNISNLYGGDQPSDIHYVGSETDTIYGLKDGVLSRYDLKERRITRLLQNIRGYQPYSDDTILFDRTGQSLTEIGIWKDDVATVVQNGASTNVPVHLKYANYQDHFYLAVASPSENTLTLYRDPLKKPILSKQLPLKTLKFENPQSVDFSDSSQFVLVQNGKNFLTYDLDELLSYAVTLPYELAPGSELEWTDSAHISAQSADGKGYFLEYDGLNSHQLTTNRLDIPLLFNNNRKYIYQFTDGEAGKSKLSAVSLVATD